MENRQTTCHTVRGEKRSLTLMWRLRCWSSCWIRHQWISPLVPVGAQGWSAVNASSSETMAPPGSPDSDKCMLPASEGRFWSRPLDCDPRSPATHLSSLSLIYPLCISAFSSVKWEIVVFPTSWQFYGDGCFWTVVLEKTRESPLDSKEIKVNAKGNQSWTFTRKTDTEVPIFWPPDVKSRLIRKDPDAGKDWRQEEKGMTEDEMVGWHHWLNGHEFE